MHTLIVGGTSGLGLSLARLAADLGSVTVTGRHDPKAAGIDYVQLDLDIPAKTLEDRIPHVLAAIPPVDIFIYAAGFEQTGRLAELSYPEIEAQLAVGLRAPIYFVRELIEAQDRLECLVIITSTSAWVTRHYEPIYAATKAGLAHFARCMGTDPHIARTLLVGTSGMNTPFWRDSQRDTSCMMDPGWVAAQIMHHMGRYSAGEIRILGAHGSLPNRVDIVSTH